MRAPKKTCEDPCLSIFCLFAYLVVPIFFRQGGSLFFWGGGMWQKESIKLGVMRLTAWFFLECSFAESSRTMLAAFNIFFIIKRSGNFRL